MFHPVGPQPPSVYWRRRLFVLGSIVALIVLLAMTVKIATSDSDGSAKADPTPSQTTPVAVPSTPSTRAHTTSPAKSTSSPAHSAHGRSTSSAPPPPAPCSRSALAVSAVVGKQSYKVGEQPLLELQVANTGSKPCVQDLADKQVVLRVYNGESRVWGSHDCKIEPGTDNRTLVPNQPVRVAITWSGLSSRPGCAGTRQRVGAGTYTLYAALSGKTGKATQFTIS